MKDVYSKLKAFTLIEVLIALTVVGLVSALTVPTLFNRYNTKTMEKMRDKTQLTVLNTLDMYLTDEGKSSLSATAMKTIDGVSNYLKTYYRINTDCSKNKNKCFADNYTNNSGETQDYPIDMPCIKSNDGATICMSPIDINSERKEGEVFIDVNATQGPNVENKDIFRLTYRNDGNLGGEKALLGSDYVLTITKDSNVTAVTPSAPLLSNYEQKTIIPTFTKGYGLKAWIKESGSCTVNSSGVVTMGEGDCRIKVTSEKIKYIITVNPGNCLNAGSTKTVLYGDTISVWANPEDGGVFDSWSGCGQSSKNKNFSFKTKKACTITANCKF